MTSSAPACAAAPAAAADITTKTMATAAAYRGRNYQSTTTTTVTAIRTIMTSWIMSVPLWCGLSQPRCPGGAGGPVAGQVNTCPPPPPASPPVAQASTSCGQVTYGAAAGGIPAGATGQCRAGRHPAGPGPLAAVPLSLEQPPTRATRLAMPEASRPGSARSAASEVNGEAVAGLRLAGPPQWTHR